MPSDWVRPNFGSTGKTSVVDKTEITNAIAALNPDQYLGTLGLIADKPVGAIKTHYTAFPSADAGAWLRVVSDATINGQEVLTDQNWSCLEDGAPSGTPAKWELSQVGAHKLIYPTHANCIGTYRRSLNLNEPHTISSGGGGNFIPFTRAVAEGCFETPFANDTQKKVFLSNLYDLVINDVQFDIYLSTQFQNDLTGIREIAVRLEIFYPENGDNFGLGLANNIYVTEENPTVFRPRLRFMPEEPLDDRPLTYAVSCTARQTSNNPLDLTFAELKILAYR